MSENKVGRPAMYSVELALEVCRRISEGESLRSVCRDDSMPSTSTVLKWAREMPEFAQQYAKARDALLEHWAEEITEIADNGSNDWMERNAKDEAGWAANGEHINRSRLRVDTRKWLLSKLAPRKYGDRMDLTNSDGSLSAAFARLISEEAGIDRPVVSGAEDPHARTH